jgi:hypothetical protein
VALHSTTLGCTLAAEELQDTIVAAFEEARHAVSAQEPVGGLAILEACCFVGAAGGVAGAVRMSAGTRERAAIDDQVFLAYRTTIKPALQDLAHSGRIAGAERDDPDTCGVIPWWGIDRQG